MPDSSEPPESAVKRFAANSAIVLSFIVALEFVIMISPFAFVFYAALNPFLLALNHSILTRWLTAFFLPHMIVPPNEPLKILRILGSWLFLGGMAVFLVCAAQIYLGRLFRKGPAVKGLYTVIRHPQYVALAFAAWGLAVMWPRFLTLTLFAVMLFLYYLLARDEERRMLNRFGDSYRAYMERTGMFLPRFVRRGRSRQPLTVGKAAGVLLVLLVVCVGSGFLLRAYTVRHLPVTQVTGVDVITITDDDLVAANQLLPAVLEDAGVATKLQAAHGRAGHRPLAYFIPVDYVMQGMIADTGEQWKLFQHHKTIRMIVEYILHPFAHLTGGHAHHMAGQPHDMTMHNSPMMQRRVIFLDIAGAEDFGINVQRTPLFFVDVHLHTAEILRVQDLPGGSGWGSVPTPMF